MKKCTKCGAFNDSSKLICEYPTGKTTCCSGKLIEETNVDKAMERLTIITKAIECDQVKLLKTEEADKNFLNNFHKQSNEEKASIWFANKSYLEQHSLSDLYFEGRNPSLLTIEQVETIWKTETQSGKKVMEIMGYNKINQKQFTEFSEELFLKYINKFSEVDKMTCIKLLMKNTNTDKCHLTSESFIYS